MRVRTQGGFTTAGGTWNYSNCTPAVTSSSTLSTENFQSGYYKETIDVVTPNFKARKLRGEVIINPFTSKTIERSGSLGSWEYSSTTSCSGKPTTFERWWGTGRGGTRLVEPSWPDITQARRIAGTAAMAGIEEAKIQGLVEMAEFGKTVRMLLNPLGNIREYLMQLRGSRYGLSKSKLAKYRRLGYTTAQLISAEYLRYRYGLKPLLSTLDTVATEAFRVRVGSRRTSRGSSSATHSSTASGNLTLNALYDYVETTEMHSEATVRAGVLYEHHYDPNYKLGLRLSDVPAAAWELIPFSLVADWFVNLGDYIQAVTPKAGVKILGSWTTVKYVGEGIYTGVLVPKAYPSRAVSAAGENVQLQRTTIVNRSPGVEVGLATKLHEIRFEKTKDWVHAADAVALIVQQLRTRV